MRPEKSRDYRLVDIRDAAELRKIFNAVRPDLVIHLAGQRQPELAERQVRETISANVFGTMSVLAAASGAGVPSVITALDREGAAFLRPGDLRRV